MSLVRRVKSFTIRKTKIKEQPLMDQKKDGVGGRSAPRQLERKKSVSYDSGPLPLHLLEIEQNALFLRQKRRNSNSGAQGLIKPPSDASRNSFPTKEPPWECCHGGDLVQSISLDELKFGCNSGRKSTRQPNARTVFGFAPQRRSCVLDGFNRNKVDAMRHVSQELDRVLVKRSPNIELIKNIEDHDNDPLNNTVSYINRPTHFPIVTSDDDDDDVDDDDDNEDGIQFRSSLSPTTKRQRNTISLPPESPQRQDQQQQEQLYRKHNILKIKGISKIQIGNEICTKIRKNERLRIANRNLEIYHRDNNTNVIVLRTLKMNVELVKGTKLVNKRDIEIRDNNNMIYLLQFDSSRDAKQFIEYENHYYTNNNNNNVNQKITIKSKLKRLLGKRNHRIHDDNNILFDYQSIIPIFGNTLQNLIYSSMIISDNNIIIPIFITKMIDLIELPQNIKSTGLYRTSGNLAIIQKIRGEIDNGKLEILDQYQMDVDVLTGTFKLFFRELKEPLIPFDVSQQFLQIIDSPSRNSLKNTDTKDIIENLPEANMLILQVLMKHLINVCDYQDDNKMTIHNMSVCWGPSLIAIPDNCNDIVRQTSNVSLVVEYLLTFFVDNPEDLVNRHDSMTERQESNDSLLSNTDQGITSISKVKLKASANSLNQIVVTSDPVYDVIKKLIDLIEVHIKTDGIYRKSGSNVKIEKILRKIERNKLSDLMKYKNDVHDLCCALKKYLTGLDDNDQLITREMFDCYWLTRDLDQMIFDQFTHQASLLMLLEHFKNVLEYETDNKMSLASLTSIWTATLMPSGEQHCKERFQRFGEFLQFLLYRYLDAQEDEYDEDEEDADDTATVLKYRESQYDNVMVPDDNVESRSPVRGEACILDEEKTDR